jgi:prepilin-type N-terminal cleavage/methylation domain-containing protein
MKISLDLAETPRVKRLRGPLPSSEDGFGLLEVVVSLVVFALLAVAAVSMLLNAVQIGRSNRNRVVAAQLAEAQIETLRGLPTQNIPTGLTTLPSVTTSGSVFYLTESAEYVASTGTGSACDSAPGAQLGFKQVTVSVTWNNMGSVKPVRSDTLKALSLSGSTPSLGSLAVSVKDRNGNPESGQVVTLSPSGGAQTTGSDGCVVYTGLTPGSYNASLNTTGYVDTTGVQASTQSSQTVNASQITKVAFVYDQASSLTVNWQAPAGGPTAAAPTLPLTLVNANVSSTGSKAYPLCGSGTCVTGTAPVVSQLFPFASGYGVFAGTCADAPPVTATQPTAVTPGSGATATVPVGEVTVTVKHGTTVVPNVALYAWHAADASCPSGQSISLGTASSTGTLNALLPYGLWTISTNATASSPPTNPWPKVTPTSTSPITLAAVNTQ